MVPIICLVYEFKVHVKDGKICAMEFSKTEQVCLQSQRQFYCVMFRYNCQLTVIDVYDAF